MKYFFNILLVIGIVVGTTANPVTKQLQAVLDGGADLILEKGKIYYIDATLKLTHPGQQIYTEHAQSIRDYATIKFTNPTLVTIINAEGLKNIVIKNVHIDGNRDNMRLEAGKISMKPFSAGVRLYLFCKSKRNY